MATITIVGAGMMGSALSYPASANGHAVRLCGTHLDGAVIDACRKNHRHPRFDVDLPAGVAFFKHDEIDAAVHNADMVICGVNSFGVDWFFEHVLKILPENTTVLSVTKGLHAYEDGRLVSFPEYWGERLGGKQLDICAIGGPCISFELGHKQNTIVTYCGKSAKALEYAKGLMQTDYYHIRTTHDVLALETAVALKNAYTLGVAFTVGIWENENPSGGKMRYNPQAAMFYQGTKEMRRLMIYLSGDCAHIDTAAGDMYVTVFGGRTRLLGTLLGKGVTLDEAMKSLKGETLESVAIITRVAEALVKLEKRGELSCADYPMMMYMYEVLSSRRFKPIPWDSFVQ